MTSVRYYTYKLRFALKYYARRLKFILFDLNPFGKHQCKYCDRKFGAIWSTHKCIHHEVNSHFMEVMMKEILPIVLVTLACVGAVKYLGELQEQESQQEVTHD